MSFPYEQLLIEKEENRKNLKQCPWNVGKDRVEEKARETTSNTIKWNLVRLVKYNIVQLSCCVGKNVSQWTSVIPTDMGQSLPVGHWLTTRPTNAAALDIDEGRGDA